MASKFINIDATGNLAERVGSVTTAASLDNLVATDPVTGKIDPSMMPSGIGAESLPVLASEALSAGDMVNIYSNAGVLNVRKADASAANQGKIADGYVKTSFANATTATVFTDVGSILTGLTGLTIGSFYFLSSTTPGALQATAPTTPGHTRQRLGKATSTTQLVYSPDEPITRA